MNGDHAKKEIGCCCLHTQGLGICQVHIAPQELPLPITVQDKQPIFYLIQESRDVSLPIPEVDKIFTHAWARASTLEHPQCQNLKCLEAQELGHTEVTPPLVPIYPLR